MSLDVEQCKLYEEWGMELESWVNKWDHEAQKYDFKRYQAPTLQKQIEFAVEKAKKKYGSDVWFQIGVLYNNGADIQDSNFEGTIDFETWGKNFSDPDAQIAMFKLQEYLEGEKK